MARSTVAALRTSPGTVTEDYRRLLHLAAYRDAFHPDRDIALHVNLSSQPFLPAASTPPWQLDGILGTLLGGDVPRERVFAWYDDAAGISISQGTVLNRHATVFDRCGIRSFRPDEKEHLAFFTPKTPLPALGTFFRSGVPVPERLAGRNILHLSTMKTDAVTTINGAVRGIFEGLTGSAGRRMTDDVHPAMVDALALHREIGAGLFTVMDAVFAGEGPNPRDLVPHEVNLILASADPVALDAVALHIMGFEPMEVPFIRIAHESGLGTGDLAEIELAGDRIPENIPCFSTAEPEGTRRIRALRNTAFAPAAGILDTVYHDWYRYLKYGEPRAAGALRGHWGSVFESYRRMSR